MTSNNKVGEIIRIEYDKDTGSVRIVIEVTDIAFKNRVMHNQEFSDIISIKGKDAMVIASHKKQ
jgi:hypothetical protein